MTDTFTIISVPGARYTSTNDINDAGEIAGTYEDVTGYYEDGSIKTVGYHGFVKKSQSLTTIDAPGAWKTEALGLNNMAKW